MALHRSGKQRVRHPSQTNAPQQPLSNDIETQPADSTKISDLMSTFGQPAHDPESRLQRHLAGQQLAHHLGNRRFGQLVQRQGVPDKTTAPAAPKTALPSRDKFMAKTHRKTGTNFDLEYVPTGPQIDRFTVGEVKIILKIHVSFKDFTDAMKSKPEFKGHTFTEADKAAFKWTPAEKEDFKKNLVKSIHDAWSFTHSFSCDSPGFDDLLATGEIDVRLVNQPFQAHNRMTAQKVPPSAPRLRSFVSGNTSTFDQRDVTDEETNRTDTPERLFRVFPFGFDSDAMNDTIEGKLTGEVEPGLRAWEATKPPTEIGPDGANPNLFVKIVGRASSQGNADHNLKLAKRRAETVTKHVDNALGHGRMAFADPQDTEAQGEQGTGSGPEFRRVDVMAYDRRTTNKEVKQNVAAHEAGHMFGLGDEYVDASGHEVGAIDKLIGDKTEHADATQAELQVPNAPGSTIVNSGSMMAVGGEVLQAHFVPFVDRLEAATKLEWTIL